MVNYVQLDLAIGPSILFPFIEIQPLGEDSESLPLRITNVCRYNVEFASIGPEVLQDRA
jgi:hypothetical protein